MTKTENGSRKDMLGESGENAGWRMRVGREEDTGDEREEVS